jgi:16S rRNA (adenine1518-N6/adenine1519-N6)-dimethyltransferase
VLLYQKEFAEKLLAVPEDHQYRFISVLAQSSAEIRVLEDVSPEAFEPKPNVRSCVVELRQKKRLDRRYADFVRELFNHKNKKIRNIIENAPEDFLEKRPTSLSPSEVSALYKTVRKT